MGQDGVVCPVDVGGCRRDCGGDTLGRVGEMVWWGHGSGKHCLGTDCCGEIVTPGHKHVQRGELEGTVMYLEKTECL